MPILPRFFLVTSDSGVTSMSLNLENAKERLFQNPNSPYMYVVECPNATWTYNYKCGYIVTLRGPLTAVVTLTPAHVSAAQAAQAAAAAGRMSPSVIAELQQRRYGHHSPANNYSAQQQQQQLVDAPFQQSMQHLPREIQMQQRLLAEMAQAEFLRLNLSGSPAGHHVSHGSTGGNAPLYTTSDIDEEREREHQETLRAEAMRKIMEAERMEEKRRRKLEKIRHMVLPTS